MTNTATADQPLSVAECNQADRPKIVALISNEWPGLYLVHELALARVGLSHVIVQETPLDGAFLSIRTLRAAIRCAGMKPALEAFLGFRYGLDAVMRRLKDKRSSPTLDDLARAGVEVRKVQKFDTAECRSLLDRLQPKVMVICGTPILPGDVLKYASDCALNIHTSVLPHYRGGGSAFWPIFFRDTEAVGYTIHEAVPQVDAGPYLFQERIRTVVTDTPKTLLQKAFVRAVPQMVTILRDWDQWRRRRETRAKPIRFAWHAPAPAVREYLQGRSTIRAALGTTVRKAAYAARSVTGVPGSGIAIFYLHRALDPATPKDDWRRVLGHPDTAEIRRKITHIRQHCQIISFSEAYQQLASGRKVKGKYAVLSVDDGYRDFRTNLVPLMEELTVSVAFFVCSGAIQTGTLWFQQLYDLIEGISGDRLKLPFADRSVWFGDVRHRVLTVEKVLASYIKRLSLPAARTRLTEILSANPISRPPGAVDQFCSADDLRSLQTNPLVALYPHSHSHHPFDRLSPEQAADDLAACRAFFSEQLGVTPSIMSYPNGTSREDLIPALQSAGIEAALSTRNGVERGGLGSRFFIRRIGLDNSPVETFHAEILKAFVG